MPASPKDRGARSFESMLYGNPMKFRQIRVDNILEVTEDDVEKACDRLFESSVKQCSKAIFCNKSDKTKKIAGNNIKIPL